MKRVLIAGVRVYQILISPILPPGSCRFHPSCSEYAIEAISRYGAGSGVLRAIKRIARCHPFHPGGFDPA
jgi:putative membrane protein insertion efficiency factor